MRDETAEPPPGWDSVSFEIEVPRQVRAGRTILIAMRLHNRSDKTITLQLLGRTMTWDVVVKDSAGREVFRLLRDRADATILRLDRLAGGEVRDMAYRWDQRADDGRPVRPGDYSLEALLLTEGDPIRSSPASIRVLPR